MPISGKADLRSGSFALSPDGGAIVLTASDKTGSRLYLRELAKTEPRPLAGTDGAEIPFWSADSRHIGFFAAKDGRGGAWNREGTILFAAAFEDALLQVRASGGEPVAATTLDMVGEARLLEERPSFLQLVQSTPIVEVADGGELLYAPVDPRPTAFVWLDRNGRRSESEVRQEGFFSFPSVSHRGHRVVMTKTNTGSYIEGSLWIFDLDHGGGSQITSRDQSSYSAVWSQDDNDLAANLFAQGEFLAFAPVWVAAESGDSRVLLEPSKRWTMPTDVSAEGRVLLYDDQVTGMLRNLGYLLLDDQPERTDYLATPADERGGRISPDGRFIACRSDISGTFEASIDTFPIPSNVLRVSTDGAALQIDFRSDGKELFILAADGDRASLFASELRPGDALEIGRPQKLFTLPVEWSGFALALKGDRFLLLERVGCHSPSLTLVDN